MKTHEASGFMSRSLGSCIFSTVASISVLFASVFVARHRFVL